MKTLHKQLSEIRELQVEEMDFVGGAGEGSSSAYSGGPTTSSGVAYDDQGVAHTWTGNDDYCATDQYNTDP